MAITSTRLYPWTHLGVVPLMLQGHGGQHDACVLGVSPWVPTS